MKTSFFIAAVILPVTASGQNNLSQLFEDCGAAGSITLYHLESDSWTYSDSADAQKETLPASAFKILNSAIALEEGVIDEYKILEWDGTENTFPAYFISSQQKSYEESVYHTIYPSI